MKILKRLLTDLLDRVFKRTVVLTNVCVIKYDEANSLGRVYKRGCVDIDDLNAKIKAGKLIGQMDSGSRFGYEGMIDLNKASLIVTGACNDDSELKICLKTLKTNEGRVLAQFIKDQTVVFRPACIGNMNADGTIDSAKIVAINAVIAFNPASSKMKEPPFLWSHMS